MLKRCIATAAGALLALGLLGGPAAAGNDAEVGGIVVENAWARATMKAVKNGAAYFVLHNTGDAKDFLVDAESPAAKKAGLHTHTMKDGVMEMGPVDRIAVEPGSPTVLEPGGLHVMLMGLNAPLKEGDSFPLTLTFEDAGTTTVDVGVKAMGAMGSGHGHGESHGHDD